MKHPWLFVLSAFLLLILAWSSLIFIAIKHTPKTVTIETTTAKP